MGFAPRAEEKGRLDFERLRYSRGRPEGTGGEAGSDALPSFLGQVVSIEEKLRAGTFCRVIPAAVLGDEREGGPGSFSVFEPAPADPVAAPIFVALIGTFVPHRGDYLVCRFVDHRWVAEATGGHQTQVVRVVIPQCFCAVPSQLRMVSGHPECNYGMFQSCALVFGPPPPALIALGQKGDAFTSPQSFRDPISNADFFYHLSCQYNQFFLARIFPTSPLGSPYRDGFLYNWIVGGYGNRCDPFQLEVGTPFPGSDATCSVMIYGA